MCWGCAGPRMDITAAKRESREQRCGCAVSDHEAIMSGRAGRTGRTGVRRRISRRAMLRAMGGAGAGLLLAACGGDRLDPFAERVERELEARQAAERAAQQSAQQGSQSAQAAQQMSQQAAVAQTQAQAQQTAQQAQAGPAEPLPTPLVYITPRPTPQGHAVLVIADAPGASSAAIAWEGEVFAMLQEGDRFFSYVGIDALTPPGPIPLSIAVWGPNGEQLLWQETALEIEAVNWPSDNIQIDGPNAALLAPAVQEADSRTRAPHQRFATPERHWTGIFDPPSDAGISAGYGELRSFNGGPISDYHRGIDFAAPNGAPIVAPGSGVVAWSGRTERRGNGMILNHGAGVFTGYYHLSEVLLQAGDVAERGAPIGRIGSTGLATGPHLHWEVVVRGVTVNPTPWIRLLEAPDPAQELDPVNAITATNLAAT